MTRVFVSVGTDHHLFDRLIDWVDRWVDGRSDIDVVLQHGASRPSPHATNIAMMGPGELGRQYDAADIVIAQVGPGTIADANAHGLRPLVVPRDPDLAEVVDDHQFAFGAFMAGKDRCWCATSEAEFRATLDRLWGDPELRRSSVIAQSSVTAQAVSDLVDEIVRSPLPRPQLSRWWAMLRGPATRSAE